MDGEQASRFVSSLVKSIQALCNGYIEFSSSIEVIGHIHLNIDRSVKLDYVLTEEVSKSISEGATVFASHSYHSQPPSSVSSKNANDTSGRSRQKQSASVTHSEDSDMVSQKHSASHFSENSEPSHTGSFVDTSDRLSGKPENRQKFSLAQESFDRRRRSAPVQSHLQRTSSPAAKRSRQSDCNSELNNTQNFEVIEIKEEPDDEPAVFFGDSSSHAAAGQDLQTPDFSNVVMESLDRVGKVEGTDLVGSGEGGQMQQQPFPIMMHANSGVPSSSVSSSVPGPSLADPQTPSLASTSGTRSRHLRSSTTTSSTTTTAANTNTNLITNNISLANTDAWDPACVDNYEQKRRDRAEAIQAAVVYVLQSGLPAYKVCNMFNVSKTTLYRHLALQTRSGEGSSPGGGRAHAGELGEVLSAAPGSSET